MKLERIYYDPKKGFVGINELANKAGVSGKEASEWLHTQETYTKHKPVRKNFERRRVEVEKIDEQWQSDLVEMQNESKENDGYRYLLTVIDVMSKYAWVRALKAKTSEEVMKAFGSIFAEGRKPEKLQTDHGKEYENKKFQSYLEKEGVKWFATHSEFKAQIVERFNRTLKNRMWKYFTAESTKRYIDKLQDLVKNYNNSYCRVIRMTPEEASKKNRKGEFVRENEVRLNFHNAYESRKKIGKAKFKVGDWVRIVKWKSPFGKGYTEGWTSEVFEVYKVIPSQPWTYKIMDWNEEPIKGSFYEEQMVKFEKKDDEWEIEKVIKERGKGRNKEYFVKWKGFPETMNSWVSEINNV